jgi:hypothetical protein
VVSEITKVLNTIPDIVRLLESVPAKTKGPRERKEDAASSMCQVLDGRSSASVVLPSSERLSVPVVRAIKDFEGFGSQPCQVHEPYDTLRTKSR